MTFPGWQELTERHPELQSLTEVHRDMIGNAILESLRAHNLPVSTGFVELGFARIKGEGRLDTIAKDLQRFTPREDESDFMRSGSIGEVRKYLEKRFEASR